MIGLILRLFGPTAATFLTNFAGPAAIVAAVALVVGAGAGAWAGRASLQGDVAEAREGRLLAEGELQRYRGDVARAAADASQRARTLEREAYEARIKERDAIVLAINEGFQRLATQEIKTRDTLKRELAAPEWACFRDPLPDAVVERLLEQANGPSP